MQTWRTHPIRTAAIAGALFGLLYVIILEVKGLSHKGSDSVLSLLLPSTGLSFTPSNLTQTILIFLIEVAVNVLVWAFLFAIPVGLVVAIRRAFLSMRRPRS